jgi:hypothetical protein
MRPSRAAAFRAGLAGSRISAFPVSIQNPNLRDVALRHAAGLIGKSEITNAIGGLAAVRAGLRRSK